MKLDDENDIQKVYLAFCALLVTIKDERYYLMDRGQIELLFAVLQILNSTAMTLKIVSDKLENVKESADIERRQN